MVQHNTLVDNNVQGNGGEMIVNYTKNCILNGNLIYNIQHSKLFFNDAGSMNLACDYNCYYAGVTADFSLNGISYSGISAWRAASNGDDNSMELDPLLVNVSLLNFHITAQSPCIATAMLLSLPRQVKRTLTHVLACKMVALTLAPMNMVLPLVYMCCKCQALRLL